MVDCASFTLALVATSSLSSLALSRSCDATRPTSAVKAERSAAADRARSRTHTCAASSRSTSSCMWRLATAMAVFKCCRRSWCWAASVADTRRCTTDSTSLAMCTSATAPWRWLTSACISTRKGTAVAHSRFHLPRQHTRRQGRSKKKEGKGVLRSRRGLGMNAVWFSKIQPSWHAAQQVVPPE